MKYIVWDMDGVVLDGHKLFQENMLDKYGISESNFKDVYFRSKEMSDYKEGKIKKDYFWNYAISKWNLSDTAPEDLVSLMIDSYSINNNVLDWINQTKDQGHKALICTNNFYERFEGVDKKFNLRSLFDFVFLSYEKQTLKPDLLDLIPTELNINNNDLLLLDDSQKNIDGARLKGYSAILCKNVNDIPSKLKEFDIVVK